MYKKILKISILFASGILFVAFHANANEFRVFVSVAPQKYFLERIGADRVDVRAVVPSREIPHTYRPSAETLNQMARADAFFSIGMRVEGAWKKRIESSNPDMLVVDTSYGIEIRPSSEIDLYEYPEQYPHLVMDPHIWLSPPLVMLQARNILTGLIKLDPDGRDVYESNYRSFIQELVELDLELRNRIVPGTEFIVYHPAWGYFAEAYALKQVTLALEGESPTPSQIKIIIEHAREREIKILMTQPQVPTPDAQRIAKEINGQVIIADPLAENWAENLRNIADILTKPEN